MTPQELLNKISTLSSEQRNAVEQFVVYLQEKKTTLSPDVRAAIDSFMVEHAELMRLLAQ